MIWGTPWHGVYSAGQVKLPNGALRAYPSNTLLPSSLPSPRAGTAYLVKRPGWTAPARSESEAAADAISGKQWRGSAVLSGAPLRLAGIPFPIQGGWVYFAPDGARWRVDIEQLSVTSGELRAQLSLRPFGRVGPPVAAVSRQLAIPISQGGGVFKGQLAYHVGVASDALSSTEPGITAELFDIASSGSRAVIRLGMSRPRFFPDSAVSMPLAVGWAEVRLFGGDSSTPPAITLHELYTRQATFGVMHPRVGSILAAKAGVTFSQVTSADPSPPAWVEDRYPQADGWSYEIRESVAVPVISTSPAAPVAAGDALSDGVSSYELTGRVLAIWYDSNDMPIPVLLSARHGSAVLARHVVNQQGSRISKVAVRNGAVGTVYETSGQYATQFDFDNQITGFLETTIAWGGHTLTLRDEAVMQASQTVRYAGSGAWQYDAQISQITLRSDGRELVGPTVQGAGNGSITISGASRPLPAGLYESYVADAAYWAAWVDWAGWSLGAAQVSVFGAHREPPPATGVGAIANRLYFTTYHVLGRFSYGGPAGAGASGSGWTVRQSEVLHSGGIDTRTYTCGYGEFRSAGWYLHGSRDPLTLQIERFRSGRVTYV